MAMSAEYLKIWSPSQVMATPQNKWNNLEWDQKKTQNKQSNIDLHSVFGRDRQSRIWEGGFNGRRVTDVFQYNQKLKITIYSIISEHMD